MEANDIIINCRNCPSNLFELYYNRPSRLMAVCHATHNIIHPSFPDNKISESEHMSKANVRQAVFKPLDNCPHIVELRKKGILPFATASIDFLKKKEMTEILKTSDYDLFSSFTSNREIDEKHVAQLVKSITKKNLLHINPILVDNKMRIIDGQHRLEAARLLKIDIFYILFDDADRQDISKLNSNQKNWNTMDYINFYTIEKRPEFLELSRFISLYPDIPISAILTIVSGKFTRNTTEIKNGVLNIENLDFAHKVAQSLAVLNKRYQHLFIYDSRFPVALAKAMNNENFNLDVFIKRIDQNPRAFVHCLTNKESGKMIEEIYNYRTSVNQIKI